MMISTILTNIFTTIFLAEDMCFNFENLVRFSIDSDHFTISQNW